jgi:hypothetical protein
MHPSSGNHEEDSPPFPTKFGLFGRYGGSTLKIDRWIVKSVSIALLSCLSASAFAVGAFFSGKTGSGEVHAPGARVFIHRTGIREDMILQIGFAGSGSQFAWVIPVPSKPTFQYTDARIFDELRSICNPRIIQDGGKPSPDLKSSPEPKPVGFVDLVVIPPGQKDALSRWLHGNGYATSEGALSVIRDYADKQWYFIVARVKASPSSGARWLQPVWITFETQRAIIPTRLTSANSTPLAAQIYVSAEKSVIADGLSAVYTTASPLRTKYKLDEFPLFFRLVRQDTRLTELRGVLDPKVLDSDIILSPK